MTKVKAIQMFEHHGRRNAGDVFEVSAVHAAELVRANLVDMVPEDADHSESAQKHAASEKQPGSAPARVRAKRQVKPESPSANAETQSDVTGTESLTTADAAEQAQEQPSDLPDVQTEQAGEQPQAPDAQSATPPGG